MQKIDSKSQIFYINKIGGTYVDADSIDSSVKIVATNANIKDIVRAALQKYGPTVDLGFVNTDNVTDMSGVFAGLTFEGSVSSWNVEKVTNMSGMFKNSMFNTSLEKWKTSSLVYMNDIFAGAKKIPNISTFSTSNVIEMARAFESTTQETIEVSKLDVSKVRNMFGTFSNSTFNGDLSKWDVSSVTNSACMFYNASFRGDIAGWNVGAITEMSYMFYGASKFSADLSKWTPKATAKMNDVFVGSPIEKNPPSWYKKK